MLQNSFNPNKKCLSFIEHAIRVKNKILFHDLLNFSKLINIEVLFLSCYNNHKFSKAHCNVQIEIYFEKPFK